MNKKDIITETERMVSPIIEQYEFELVDVEYVKEGSQYYLRVYADKQGGITINDLELISRALEKKLDAIDLVKEKYILEVSSPGLDRKLKKDKDFERYQGSEVDLKLYKNQNGSKDFQGILLDYDKDQIKLEIDGQAVAFDRKDISYVKLAIRF